MRGTSADIMASCRLKELAAIVIGDCTERFTQAPNRSELHNFLWSRYKHHCILKILTGVVSCGFTCHYSLWGPASDDSVMAASSLPRDLGNVEGRNGRPICYMYDRGIEELVEFLDNAIFVDTPPKAKDHQKLFSLESVEHSKKQAAGRITVEHVNRLMWEYAAASREVNLSRIDMVDHEMRTTIGLVNLKPAHSAKAEATSCETIKLLTSTEQQVAVASESRKRKAANDAPS